jgi:hypothetical protein
VERVPAGSFIPTLYVAGRYTDLGANIDLQRSIRKVDWWGVCIIAHNEHDAQIVSILRGEHHLEKLETGMYGITAKFTQPPCTHENTKKFVP